VEAIVIDSVQCACGAKLRVPPGLQGKVVQCPRCKAQLTLAPTAAATQPSAAEKFVFTAPPTNAAVTCPICLSVVREGEVVHRCPECDIVHHEECWAEVGGCSTFGCKQAPAIDKSEQSPQAPLTAWGDTKVCPVCGETIKSIALLCRYCGMEFSSVDPLSVADLRQQAQASQKSDLLKKYVIGAFIASLTGVLAPFSLVFALAYLLPRRQQVAKAGPLFEILGWITIAVSALYCMLILGFASLSG
jgi:hypothetical protein